MAEGDQPFSGETRTHTDRERQRAVDLISGFVRNNQVQAIDFTDGIYLSDEARARRIQIIKDIQERQRPVVRMRRSAHALSSRIQNHVARASFELRKLRGRLPKTQEDWEKLLIQSLATSLGNASVTYGPGFEEMLKDTLLHTRVDILVGDAVTIPASVRIHRGGIPHARNTYVDTMVANFDGLLFENGQSYPCPPEAKGNVLLVHIPNADALLSEPDTSLALSLPQRFPALLTHATAAFSTRGTEYTLFLDPKTFTVENHQRQSLAPSKYGDIFDMMAKFMRPGD